MIADSLPPPSSSSSGPLSFPDSSALMVLESPLLRVSRPVAACQRCRAAKVKCDGKLPACTACEKSNKAAECSSANDQFARGKERSYVATLEGRVEKLEKKLAEARARRKSSAAMLDVDDAATPRRLSVDMLVNSGNNSSRKPPSKRAARRKEASDIDELVSDFGLLAVNATARDFYGFTSSMSYARLILSACSKEPMPEGMVKTLPPRYAATPLIQHYFNNIFVLLPIFDEATFYASVDAVYSTDRQASSFDHWTVRLVLALASISCSDQRGDTHYVDAVGYVNAALQFAEDVLHPGFISNIQALILLAIYATMDPQHFDGWHLIGAASRAMVDLGMHQDPSKSSGTSKAKLELRRRVYWCVYALDRSTSLVHSRAFSFSDDSSNVAYPFQGSISPAKSPPPKAHLWLQSFDSAMNLFELRKIQSKWYTDLFQTARDAWSDPYPYIWRTYHAMTEWYNNISSSTLPCTKAFFELELLYSYVYILSPSPRCPRVSSYAKRLIFEHCIAYSTNMLAVLNDASSPTTKTPLTFYDAMRASMTARQFLDVLGRNFEIVLDPIIPAPPITPPSATNRPMSHDDSNVDPFSAAGSQQTPNYPPPFPAPAIPRHTPSADLNSPPPATDPTSRAIAAINDFTTILSRFGARFGHINWRDRFQADSSPLLNQLYNRAAGNSPSVSPKQPFSATQPYPFPHQQQQQQQPGQADIPPPPIPLGARTYEWGSSVSPAAPAGGVGYGMGRQQQQQQAQQQTGTSQGPMPVMPGWTM